jgi:alpha-L-arabinofuranosidase
MYAKHFGNILIKSEVKCESYRVNKIEVPYLSINASRNEDESKIFIMVINKNIDITVTAAIDLKGFIPGKEGNAWILNGPSIDATNEKDHNNVRITRKRIAIKGNPFKVSFEPHSLTALEIERIK